MANAVTAPTPILIDRAKLGDATGGDYEVRNGVEAIPTNDGVVMTNGRTTTTATFNSIIPRAGQKARLAEAVVNKKDCKIQLVIDGKMHEVDGKFVSAKYDWDQAAGRMNGSFQFVGGEPSLL